MLFFEPEDLLDLFLTDELVEEWLGAAFVVAVIAIAICAWLIWLRTSCPGRTFLSLFMYGIVATGLTFAPVVAGPLTSWVLSTTPTDLLTQHCFMASFAVGVYISAVMRQPTRIPGRTGPLLEIDDGDFYARVCELSGRMRVACPVVRIARSATADHATMAFAGGLLAPSIIVTDGIITRLKANERDAVVGHELAHIANGTFCYLMVVASLAGIGMAIAMACSVATSILIGTALFIGLQRLIMRRLELDCDLRAARAIGFPETATALQKIHRLGIDGMTSPWLRRLIHATGSHPPLAARLEYLKSHAPDEDQPLMPDPDHNETLVAWMAAGGWLLCVCTGWWLGLRPDWPSTGISATLLFAATMTPWLLLQASQNREALKLQFLQIALSGVWVALGLLALGTLWLLSIAAVSLNEPGSESMLSSFLPMITWAMGLLFVIAIVFAVARFGRRQQFYSDLIAAWEGHDFINVLKLIKRNRRSAKADPDVLYREAMAHAILGEREEAVQIFQNIVARHPKAINYQIALTATMIEMSQFEQALSLCDPMIRDFPKDGIGQAMASRCLRRMGRLEEARSLIRQGVECNPQIGAYYAAEAGIAVDQGDFESARDLLRKAGEVAPGTPQELIEEARLALRTESGPIVIQKLQRAIDALKANPLILRQSELVSLRQQLAQLNREVATPTNDDAAEWVTEFVDDADLAADC